MDEHTIEQGFENIEEILEKMESKDIALEASFELYKEAMNELKYCHDKISETQKAVMAIQADGSLAVFEE